LSKLVRIAKPALGSYAKFLPKAPAPLPFAVKPKVDEPFVPEVDEEEDGKQLPAKSSGTGKPQPESRPPAGPPPRRAPTIAAPPPSAQLPSSAPTSIPAISRESVDPNEEDEHPSQKRKEGGEDDHDQESAPRPAEKKRKVYGAMTKEKFVELTGGDEATEWEPPTNQSGDGKTSLNAKYGY